MPRITAIVVLAASTLAFGAGPAQATDKDCSDFPSQKSAQIFYLKAGGPSSDPHGLDSDNDGIACESNPAPYYYGTTVPGGGGGGGGSQPAPPPKPEVVKSKVNLRTSAAKVIKGESVRLTSTVAPRGVRTVLLQQRTSGRWHLVSRVTTNRSGKAVRTLRAPSQSVTYRAVVVGETVGDKKFTTATSDGRNLTVQPQRVVLSFDRSAVGEGESLEVAVRATPVRVGRTISVQVLRDGRWRPLHTVREDRRGRGSFSMMAGLAGEYTYRAVAVAWRGAPAQKSFERTLTVTDRTAPSAPIVTATGGDASALVSWSAVDADDLSHYEVWVRQDGVDTWTLVASTTDTSMFVSPLANDTTYWFTVTSVDLAGNQSAQGTGVSAVPSAPVPTP